MPIRRAKPAPDFLLPLMLGAALAISGAAFAQDPDPESEAEATQQPDEEPEAAPAPAAARLPHLQKQWARDASTDGRATHHFGVFAQIIGAESQVPHGRCSDKAIACPFHE